jgi:hypothetical protein
MVPRNPFAMPMSRSTSHPTEVTFIACEAVLADLSRHSRGFWVVAALLSFLSGAFAAEKQLSRAVAPAAARVETLFDGKSLAGWAESGFEGEARVKVQPGFRDGRAAIVIDSGSPLSGITWRDGSTLPRVNYELSLEAMRIEGGDFFCGLTFPVGKSACTLVVGGWGGNIVGLSNVDDLDASENQTGFSRDFEDGRWYRIRVRVTADKIEAWIDGAQVIELELRDRKINLRPGDIHRSLPLGIATYVTRAAIRDVQLRRW